MFFRKMNMVKDVCKNREILQSKPTAQGLNFKLIKILHYIKFSTWFCFRWKLSCKSVSSIFFNCHSYLRLKRYFVSEPSMKIIFSNESSKLFFEERRSLSGPSLVVVGRESSLSDFQWMIRFLNSNLLLTGHIIQNND